MSNVTPHSHNYCKADSVGKAWLRVCRIILTHGQANIEDDKGTIVELIPFTIEIHNPPISDAIVDSYGDKDVLAFMARNFQNSSPIEGWGYSYAQRLYTSPTGNQIEHAIAVLKQNRLAKSATVSLLFHEADTVHKPCLVALDFKIRNDVLLINAFFRSQDIGKKMYADAFELLKIGQAMAAQLSVKEITLIHSICSAHIYTNDVEHIQRMLQRCTF